MLTDGITISCAGKGSADFTGQIEAAGIEYTTFEKKPDVTYPAAADVLCFAAHSAPYAALASVLHAWCRARASRCLIVTTKAYKIVHAKSYSVGELQQLLIHTSRVSVVDPAPLDELERPIRLDLSVPDEQYALSF